MNLVRIIRRIINQDKNELSMSIRIKNSNLIKSVRYVFIFVCNPRIGKIS